MTGTALDELILWRDQAIADGTLSAGTIKDAQLSQIVRSNRRTSSEIERMLPRSARPMAVHIATVLDEGGSTPQPDQAAHPPSPAPPAHAEAARSAIDHPESTALRAAPGRDTEGKAALRGRPNRAHAQPAGQLDLGHDDFCGFGYGQSDNVVHTLTIQALPDGFALTWPEFEVEDGEVAVYRVIANEDTAAYKPEVGRMIAATQVNSAADSAPLTAAVRYIDIWCHVGKDVRDAAANQPFVIAKGQIVSGVADFAITEEEGAVIGRWSVWPGVSKVQVLRIPLDQPRPGGDAQFRICAADHNLTGFVDRGAERGKPYLYRVICEVAIDGVTRLSKPEQAEVLLSVVLEPVADLKVQANVEGDNQAFDLDWTNPAEGRVVVYRTESAPKPGIGDAALAAAALESGGLPQSAELKYPSVAIAPGRSGMRRVPVPRGWPRAYFTPVTVLGDSVQVGRTVSAARQLAAVRNARLVERCFEQILTFAWPDGAASVSVYLGRQDVSVAQSMSQAPIAEVARRTYERDGGVRLSAPLVPGCAVHLVPVAYAAGQRLMGEPASVSYAGLLRIWYMLRHNGTDKSPATEVAIGIAPDADNPSSPPFVLVHNPQRLPLSASDGAPLTVRGVGDPGPGAKSFHPDRLARDDKTLKWTASIAGLTGYIRLFADLPPAHARAVAVIDPPIGLLRLAPVGVSG